MAQVITVSRLRSGKYFVIILFVALLAYVLLSGKGKRRKVAEQQDGDEKAQDLATDGQGEVTKPSFGAPNDQGQASRTEPSADQIARPEAETPRNTTTSTTPDTPSSTEQGKDEKDAKEAQERAKKELEEKKAKEKKEKKEKEKAAREKANLPRDNPYHHDYPEPTTPPPLTPLLPSSQRPDDRKKILRRRSEDDILTTSPNTSAKNRVHYVDEGENAAPDVVTSHVRKNPDHVGSTPVEGPFPHMPPKYPPGVHDAFEHKHVPPMKIEDRKANKLKGEIKERLLNLLLEAEQIVQAKPDSELWPKAMREEWDPIHGVIPHFAKDVCGWIGRAIEQNVSQVAQIMTERHKRGTRMDIKRSYSSFLKSRVKKESPSGPELTVGWFCDWFRLVDQRERMATADVPIDMSKELGVTAKLLAWIEMFARLCVRQRITAPSGIDLHCLIMRVGIVQEQHEWRMDLTFFLPSAPHKMRSNDIREWTLAVIGSEDALRALYAEMRSIFGEVFFVIRRRRLIFRPGFAVDSVNGQGGVSRPTGDFSIAQAVRLSRKPEVLNLPPDILQKVNPGLMQGIRKPLAMLQPREVLFHRKRQYHWHEASITETSNAFHPLTFALGFEIAGSAFQDGDKDDRGTMGLAPRNEFIQLIDLGGLIPIVEGPPSRLFEPQGFSALRVIVLPYVPSSNKTFNTAKLVLGKAFGLQDWMIRQTKPLMLYLTIAPGFVRQLEIELGEEVIQNVRQELFSQGKDKAKVKAHWDRLLKKVVSMTRVVEDSDHSEVGQRLEGKSFSVALNWPADLS